MARIDWRANSTTVMRGMMGFGAHSRMHTFKIERLSQDLPIIIEIVNTREKLEKILSLIDNEIEEGMATLEKAQIHFYRSRSEEHTLNSSHECTSYAVFCLKKKNQ